jgi:hypothetical protein
LISTQLDGPTACGADTAASDQGGCREGHRSLLHNSPRRLRVRPSERPPAVPKRTTLPNAPEFQEREFRGGVENIISTGRHYHARQLPRLGTHPRIGRGRVPSTVAPAAPLRGHMPGGVTQGMSTYIVGQHKRRRCPRAAGTRRAHGSCAAIAALLVGQARCARPLRMLRRAQSMHRIL